MKTKLGLLMGLGAISFLVAGCAEPEVIPAGGAPQASANAGPAVLTVMAASWAGEPSNLAEYLTPVAVQLNNNGPNEVRVSYGDFQLVDSAGTRYAAINPFGSAQQQQQQAPAAAPSGRLDLPATKDYGDVALQSTDPHAYQVSGNEPINEPVNEIVLAGFHGRGGGGVRIGPPMRGHYMPRPYGGPGRVMVGPRAYGVGPRGAYFGLGDRWRGYTPLPGYRPYFGVGYNYWGGPWLATPGYADWVWGWSPDYYPAPEPPADVISSALPEGVLQANGHVDGFLYFQHVHDGIRTLTLAFDAHDAQSGAALGQGTLPLDLVE